MVLETSMLFVFFAWFHHKDCDALIWIFTCINISTAKYNDSVEMKIGHFFMNAY